MPKGRRVKFLDVQKSTESSEETSKSNEDEAQCTLELVKHIHKGINFKGRVGIITPYKAQVKLLKNLIGTWLRSVGCKYSDVEINTVDAFQGREKDIIIVSCVRSNSLDSEKASLGFLIDDRRMNVAITRARHLLVVIGNSATLKKHPAWKSFIEQADCSIIEQPFKTAINNIM